MTPAGAPERACTRCHRIKDLLDGVQTGADFECGPCFVTREMSDKILLRECESDIAHQSHTWCLGGTFHCPGVEPMTPFEVAALDRLLEVARCFHLWQGRTCWRCGSTMRPAAAEKTHRERNES